MQLQIGDHVVHPVHGVGTVKTFSQQQFFSDKARAYYQVAVGSVTIWVPSDEQGTSVLRRVAPKESLDECRRLLKRHPVSLDKDRKIRGAEVARLLKDRMLPALCETVRDLTAHGRQKPLGATENELLKRTFKALCDEWAAADGVTAKTALNEIESLLHEGHWKLIPE